MFPKMKNEHFPAGPSDGAFPRKPAVSNPTPWELYLSQVQKSSSGESDRCDQILPDFPIQSNWTPDFLRAGGRHFRMENVRVDSVYVDPCLCHRDALSKKRLIDLNNGIRSGEIMFPLLLLEENGTSIKELGDNIENPTKLIVIDGIHRYEVAGKIGIERWPALILRCTRAEAICMAISMNWAPSKILRQGPDAKRSLMVLGLTLGREVTRAEANLIGLCYDKNAWLEASQPGFQLGKAKVPTWAPVSPRKAASEVKGKQNPPVVKAKAEQKNLPGAKAMKKSSRKNRRRGRG